MMMMPDKQITWHSQYLMRGSLIAHSSGLLWTNSIFVSGWFFIILKKRVLDDEWTFSVISWGFIIEKGNNQYLMRGSLITHSPGSLLTNSIFVSAWFFFLIFLIFILNKRVLDDEWTFTVISWGFIIEKGNNHNLTFQYWDTILPWVSVWLDDFVDISSG